MIIKNINIALVAAVLIAIGFPATQLSAQEKVDIFSIDVLGNKTSSAETIKRNSGLLPGKSINGDDIQAAVKKLWALKLFSDVQILVQKQVEEGLYLLIRVEEYPRLEKIELKGNDKIKQAAIDEAITFFQGQHILRSAIAPTRALPT